MNIQYIVTGVSLVGSLAICGVWFGCGWMPRNLWSYMYAGSLVALGPVAFWFTLSGVYQD